jgi:hypothetical protein
MFFFRKQKFFLDLSEQGKGQEEAAKGGDTKVTLAPPAPAKPQAEKAAPSAPPAPAPAPVAAVASAPAAPVAPPAALAEAAAAAPAAPLRTTAEEIAAQLAAEAASRPAPTFSTFAPECVVPGGATPRQRRKAGANLGAFKAMAKGMMKS